MLETVCRQETIPFLRLFEIWEDKKKEGLFTDGLHPNSKGHQLLSEQIFNKLTELKFI
jgi:lysophospholipase L1-like esterase